MRQDRQMPRLIMANKKIAISIVSHGHGEMILGLVNCLLKYSEIAQIIITLNIPEEIYIPENARVKILKNNQPLGFGENHNIAFENCNDLYFCVLNPDVELVENPFPSLIKVLEKESVGVTGPIIENNDGLAIDSQRKDLTLGSIINRYLFRRRVNAKDNIKKNVDWISGAFMLFKADLFKMIGGFDVNYFMYCEDADICRRVRLFGFLVEVDISSRIIHDAKRASHSNFKYFVWHVRSLIRYLKKY